MKQTALEYLQKNYLLNIDMIESINFGESEIAYANEFGVLLKKSNGLYMISADYYENFLNKIDTTDFIVIHQNEYYDYTSKKFGLYNKFECCVAVYTQKIPLPMPKSDFEIRQLGEEWVDFVVKHYSKDEDREYILSRICAGVMFGAFIGDKMAGFIGIHDDGAMGILEVLQQYKRQGIGSMLESFQINRQLNKGRVPYAHIITGNTASLNLQKKLGLSIADKKICWMF